MNIDNKGFTLIELIITIALLSVISIISFVSITGTINQSKINDCESLEMNIKSAAKEYVSDNRYNIVVRNDKEYFVIDSDKGEETEIIKNNENGVQKKFIYIKAYNLKTKHYLSGDIIDPFNGSNKLKGDDITIKIELDDDYSAMNFKIYKDVNNSDYNCNKDWFSNLKKAD